MVIRGGLLAPKAKKAPSASLVKGREWKPARGFAFEKSHHALFTGLLMAFDEENITKCSSSYYRCAQVQRRVWSWYKLKTLKRTFLFKLSGSDSCVWFWERAPRNT